MPSSASTFLISLGSCCKAISAALNSLVNCILSGAITLLWKLVMSVWRVEFSLLMLLRSTVKAPSAGLMKLVNCWSSELANPLSAEPWKKFCTWLKLFWRALLRVVLLVLRVPSGPTVMPMEERLVTTALEPEPVVAV